MLFCRLHRQKGLNVNLFSYEIRHGAGKPTSKVIEEVRDIYAFIGTPPSGDTTPCRMTGVTLHTLPPVAPLATLLYYRGTLLIR